MSQKNPKSPKSPGNALEVIGKSGGIKLDDIDLQQLTAISVPIKKRINALKNEQVKLLELEKKFYEELHELECRYAKLYEPIYEKRRKIVIGEVEPSEEEAKWALDEADEDDEKKEEGEEANGEKTKEQDKPPAIDESKLTDSAKKLLGDLKKQFDVKKGTSEEKGIPNFWLETLQAFRITAEMIQEHDEPVLAYLQDIRARMHEKKPFGYTLEFEFAENPYFTNKVLTKTFDLKIDVDATDPFSFEGPDLERCTGCKIDWKSGKNVTVRLIKKKIKGRNKKAPAKTITKEEKQESFFTFFETRPEVKSGGAKSSGGKARQTSESGASDSGKQVAVKKNHHPDDEDEEEDEIDEETAHDLYLMTEYETGQYIKDKIIPKAVLYFSGELDEMDDDEYDDGEDYDEDDEELDDDDDDDDDEDDDDDDDDDDEDDHPKGGKKGGPAGGKGGKKGGKPGHHHHKGEGGKPGEPTPSECKQN